MQKTGRLELTWVGKYDEKVIEPRILLEDQSKSYGDLSSGNMLIHGDNLIALQALQQDFAGKIKCIYIDPPYNTGSAFEYYDDGLEHSEWLQMIYPRVQLLHELLADDGFMCCHIEDDPFRKYVGVCAPGQSVKTALLRVYAIILQAAYTYSLQDEYKDVIDPYYSLVGYFNSIRELGGAVRLLQDDIPKRIYRIKNKYGLDKQRYLNHNVEITSRMSSYKIPEKLNQLETTCDSKDCLDTAIATNMIAVGMDVDRLGLMVVTGQPKQNSEYIQATSRIGRAFPGLVVTLYNAYRPRDLSHYENFTGYHSQLYRFVEGTTATPFSARARDRVMHALIISAIRLNFPNMANNPDAAAIGSLTTEQLDSVKKLIIDRLNIIKPSARADAEEEIDRFIDWWKLQAAQTKPLRYYVVGTERYNRLMNPYDQPHDENEKATLRSMREVESSANMFYYTED